MTVALSLLVKLYLSVENILAGYIGKHIKVLFL